MDNNDAVGNRRRHSMWPGPHLVFQTVRLGNREVCAVKPPFGTLLCVVILKVFLRRSCQLLGH